MVKRIISGLLCLALLLSIMPINALAAPRYNIAEQTENVPAASIIASGECGDNLRWTLNSDMLLRISGTGAMTRSYGWSDYQAAIKTIIIEQGATSIDSFAFDDCSSLTSVTIPSSVTIIGNYAFYGCSNLTNIKIPNGVTVIGNSVFAKCGSLATIKIPDSVTSIGSDAFYYCSSLKSVTLSNGLTGIADDMFYNCRSLTSIVIPKGVTAIEEWAFRGCENLKTITFSKNVKRIERYAFYLCDRLTDVYYDGSKADWGKINIDSTGNSSLTSAAIHYTLPTPTNVNAVVDTAATIKISWKAVSGATKYVVYCKEGSADWKALTTVSATSVILRTNLKPGYNYRLRIYAKDNSTGVSEGSEVALVKFVPPTPTGLTIASTGVGQATIKWDALPGATGYCVYYKRADDTGYTYAGATTATSKTITGLTTGARYAFKIRAYVKATAGVYAGTNVFSEYCKYVSGEIVPAAPTGLKIASTAAGKATITWNKVSGAYAYCIYYKRADDAGYTYFGATTATSKTITGLTTGARYAFKIRAYAKPTTGPKAGQNVFGPYCKYVSGAITAN